MSVVLKPTEEIIRDLKLLLSPNYDATSILTFLEQLVPSSPTLASLIRGGDTDGDRALIRQAVSLYRVAYSYKMKTTDLLDSIRQAIDANPDLAGAQAQSRRWNGLRDELDRACTYSSVRTVAKALELISDYANELVRAKLLVDVRPIFDESGDEIESAVTSLVLRIDYGSSDVLHTISLATTVDQIEELRAECERAILKHKRAVEKIERVASKRTET
jgi:hypothetical protein